MTPVTSYGIPPKKKRNRKYVVCVACRQKRIKCDRKKPCSNCVRGQVECVYTPKPRNDSASPRLEYDSYEGSIEHTVSPGVAELILQLQQQVNALAAKSGPVAGPPSILDQPIPSIKRRTVMYNEENIVHWGPSSSYRIASYTAEDIGFQLFDWINRNLEKERKAWEQLHGGGRHQIDILDSPVESEGGLASQLNGIAHNFYAFQERLRFFELHLNSLLFNSFVPMNIVDRIFFSRFTVPDANKESVFIRPERSFQYAGVALILTIVFLSQIFTRHNSDSKRFRYPIEGVSDRELQTLALSCLSASEYRNKHNDISLLALVLIRTAIFDFSNTVDDRVNTYPFFQTCLNSCYELGLHVCADPDIQYRQRGEPGLTMSREQKIKLWRYIQILDATFSLERGTPLMISEDFCMGFDRSSKIVREQVQEGFLDLLRRVSIALNSIKPICVREALQLLDAVKEFMERNPYGFSYSASLDDSSLDLVAEGLKIKLTCMLAIQTICHATAHGIATVWQTQLDETSRDQLRQVSKRLFDEAVISSAMVSYQTTDMMGGRTIFGSEPDGRYIVYLRELLTVGCRPSVGLWITAAFSRMYKSWGFFSRVQAVEVVTEYPNGPPLEGDITMRVLEDALFQRSSKEDALRLVARLVSLAELMNVGTSLFRAMLTSEVLNESLDTFVSFKMLIIWLYIMQASEEGRKKNGSSLAARADAVKLARERVEANFHPGRVDDHVLEDSKQISTESAFSSLFTDSDWKDIGDLLEQNRGVVFSPGTGVWPF